MNGRSYCLNKTVHGFHTFSSVQFSEVVLKLQKRKTTQTYGTSSIDVLRVKTYSYEHHAIQYTTDAKELRTSYFWRDWEYYVSLGMPHTMFSTPRSHSSFTLNCQSQVLEISYAYHLSRIVCLKQGTRQEYGDIEH